MTEQEQIQLGKIGFRAMWKFGGLTPWDLVFHSIKGYNKHRLSAHSAQFAYYAIFTLVPLLIVIIACVAQLPIQGIILSMENAINQGLPQSVSQMLFAQIEDIQQKTTYSLIIAGLFLLSLGGMRLFLTMGTGLDAVFEVDHRRSFWKSGGLSLLLTFGVLLLLLIAMILLVIGPEMARLLLPNFNAPWIHLLLSVSVRWSVACGFMLISTSVIYWSVPSVKLPWKLFTPGSLFVVISWVIMLQGFRYYVENMAHYNETYGTLGGFIVLLAWLYMTGAILMMGGEINGVIYRSAREKAENQ
ncbi:MAG: YihY/virulence factor BrkB family protein [Planctomycetes bacterium]|nr:YihY/virulence factor BrkB family protein [Planctomycetota bacterium]MCH9724497.1 YihY/virulence factor BrkB family protein [Planctomycetota bacterium]MCH9774844.1 YihY/virulence factor BrkB family protein [Planctomycetota bacterium]MCH9792839.1 YihY/virulence factor BrkB family protein [Planctomycetota bacterium]MDF1743600.1 YihY/virulence factor BrkB family protein [Gimesia sp.]